MDILGPFLEECCEITPSGTVTAKELYEKYSRWCYENGEIILKNRAFYRVMETKGFRKFRGAGNKYFFEGVTFLSEKVTKKLPNSGSKVTKITKSNFFVTR